MFFIGVCYLGASAAFIYEGKLMWATVALSWGVGNALLAVLSK